MPGSDATRDLPKTDKGLQAHIANVRPPADRKWLTLGGGLTLCLEPSGIKTFQARIRRQGDKSARRIRIGSFPALSVADARRKLAEMKSVIREGRDPALEQRRARSGVSKLRTLGDLIAEYLARRENQIAPKTLKIERDLLHGVLAPALGDRLLADLEPVDFGKVVSDYAARLKREGRSNGTNANKLLAASRRMFKTARGLGVVGSADPTAGLAKPAKEAPRDRILFDGVVLVGPDPRLNELGRLVCALTAEPSLLPASAPTRAGLLLTLRLGLRALETSSLEWRAVDLDSSAPSVTVTTSKTSAGLRALPLPRAAAAALRDLRTNSKVRDFYSPRKPDRNAQDTCTRSRSRALSREPASAWVSPAPRLHDLRRTCLSGLIELGHESVAERIAGHVPRHVMGRHYDRSSRMEAMRAGLEAWSEAIDAAAARFAEGQS